MDEFLVRNYAIDLMAEATGGDASYMEDLADNHDIGRNEVVDLLRKAKIPMAAPLLADVDRIFDREEPRYFLPHDRVVELYREHHHPLVDFVEPDHGSRHVSEYVGSVVDELEQEILQRERHGISLEPYRLGAACLAEQKFFYQTEEWKNRAAVLKIIDQFTCKECGRRGREVELHAHHGEYIYSVFSREFYRNFDVGRVRCLCESCHTSFHQSHVRGHSHFTIGGPVELTQRSKRRHALEQLHDFARECRFCFGKDAFGAPTRRFFSNN